jgi:hypothetical protein
MKKIGIFFVCTVLLLSGVYGILPTAQAAQAPAFAKWKIFGGSTSIFGGFARLFTAYSPTVEPQDLTPFVEDVFSTYLYTGNGSSQTITNGIDLAGDGGMVWIKERGSPTNLDGSNFIYDTIRGIAKYSEPHSTGAQGDSSLTQVSSVSSTGFSISYSTGNTDTAKYTSWTFKEAPGFFDVVTFTGNGVSTPGGQVVNHSLGVAPGMILVKNLSNSANWMVYHRSHGGGKYLQLNNTNAPADLGADYWLADSTSFSFAGMSNTNGDQFVAYLFAHDTSADGIIQAGTFTTDGNGNSIQQNLGWEPQYILMKGGNATNWQIVDAARGATASGTDARLYANSAAAESSANIVDFNATGFISGGSMLSTNDTYVYLAIRKGPMKTPTNGTEVYNAIARTGTAAAANVSGVGFAPDLIISKPTTSAYVSAFWDRLRGKLQYLTGNSSATEGTSSDGIVDFTNDGVSLGTDSSSNYINGSATPYINWFFKRTPWVFDEVTYTGTGSTRTVSHNLGVTPEMMIVKSRGAARGWMVYGLPLGVDGSGYPKGLQLHWTGAADVFGSSYWNAVPSSTTFTVGGVHDVNNSGESFVAYLFASKPLVSKVGSYTGNGSTQNINANFSATARFIMIKRTDSTGDWYVWDSTRGINSGNDPHLSLNTTFAEVTTDDSIDSYSLGFAVNQDAATNINVNAATYIYLAFQ